MLFTFKINNPIKKLFMASLVTFVSGVVISAVTVKKGFYNSEKKKDSISHSIYYTQLIKWIQTTKTNTENEGSLKGIRIFLTKENEIWTKNIIRLYFCNESNNEWKEVISEKNIKIDTLTSDIKNKLRFLEKGEQIEITDMILKK